ncbi:KxYKxGKxW signal peptide domain-containing protein, partial [Secundilactobacillus silagei]|uniref:KxYKxGKxW signal peptide domain-containing protein n=2 Tax=Secundilactobacillus silagei TaxID=1293415 RepID=UPI001476FF59
MNSRRFMKSRNQLLRDEGQTKTHYKMYKAHKKWLYAGISMLFFGAGMLLTDVNVQADSDSSNANSTDTTAVETAPSQALQQKSVVLGTGAANSVSSDSASDAAAPKTADTTGSTTAENAGTAANDNATQNTRGDKVSSASADTAANTDQSAAKSTTQSKTGTETGNQPASSTVTDNSATKTSDADSQNETPVTKAASDSSTKQATDKQATENDNQSAAKSAAATTDKAKTADTSSALFAKDGSLSDAAKALIAVQDKTNLNTTNATSKTGDATATNNGKTASVSAVTDKLAQALAKLPDGSAFKTLADGTVEFDLPAGVTSEELQSAQNALANSGLKAIKVTAVEDGNTTGWRNYDTLGTDNVKANTGVKTGYLENVLRTPMTMADFALMTAAGTGAFNDPVTNANVTNATATQLQTFYNDLVTKYGPSGVHLTNALSDGVLSDTANGNATTIENFAGMMDYLSKMYYYFVGSSDSYVNQLVDKLNKSTSDMQVAMTEYGHGADTDILHVFELANNVFSTKYIMPVNEGSTQQDLKASAMDSYTTLDSTDPTFAKDIFEPFINGIVGTYISEIVPGAEKYIIENVVPAVNTISDTRNSTVSDKAGVLAATNANSNALTHTLMTLDGSYSLTTIITHIEAMYQKIGSSFDGSIFTSWIPAFMSLDSNAYVGVYVGALEPSNNLTFDHDKLAGNATPFYNFSMYNQLYLAYSKAIVSAAYGYAMVGKYNAIKLMYSENPSDPNAVWNGMNVSTKPADIDISKFGSQVAPTSDVAGTTVQNDVIKQTYQQGIWDVYHYIKPFYDQAIKDKAANNAISSSDPDFVNKVWNEVKGSLVDTTGAAVTTNYTGTDTGSANPHDQSNYASPQTQAYLASFYANAVGENQLSYSLQPTLETVVQDASGSVIKTNYTPLGKPVMTGSNGQPLVGSFGGQADLSNLPQTAYDAENNPYQKPANLTSVIIPESGGLINVPYDVETVTAGQVTVQQKGAPADATFDYTITDSTGKVMGGAHGATYSDTNKIDLSDGQTINISVPTTTGYVTSVTPQSSISYNDTINAINKITVNYGHLVNYTVQAKSASGDVLGTSASISGVSGAPIDVSKLPVINGYTAPKFNDNDTNTKNDTPVIPTTDGAVAVTYVGDAQTLTVTQTGAPTGQEMPTPSFTYKVNQDTTEQTGTYGAAINVHTGDKITITPGAVSNYHAAGSAVTVKPTATKAVVNYIGNNATLTINQVGLPAGSNPGFTYVDGSDAAKQGTYGTNLTVHYGDHIVITAGAFPNYTPTFGTETINTMGNTASVNFVYVIDTKTVPLSLANASGQAISGTYDGTTKASDLLKKAVQTGDGTSWLAWNTGALGTYLNDPANSSAKTIFLTSLKNMGTDQNFTKYFSVDGDGTDVKQGGYDYSLTADGIAKINAALFTAGNKYQVTFTPDATKGKVNIKQLGVTVTPVVTGFTSKSTVKTVTPEGGGAPVSESVLTITPTATLTYTVTGKPTTNVPSTTGLVTAFPDADDYAVTNQTDFTQVKVAVSAKGLGVLSAANGNYAFTSATVPVDTVSASFAYTDLGSPVPTVLFTDHVVDMVNASTNGNNRTYTVNLAGFPNGNLYQLQNPADKTVTYNFTNNKSHLIYLTHLNTTIPVTVTDTNGTALKSGTVTVDPLDKPNGTTTVDPTVDGYPVSQLHSITTTYINDVARNPQGVVKLVSTMTADGTSFTTIRTHADGTIENMGTTNATQFQTAGQLMAKMYTGGGSPISFGSPVTITTPNNFVPFASVQVVYNAKATANITFHDDTDNKDLPDTQTVSDFPGGSAQNVVVNIPTNYVLAPSMTTGANLTIAPGVVTYTGRVTNDDYDNAVVHLVHKTTTINPNDTTTDTDDYKATHKMISVNVTTNNPDGGTVTNGTQSAVYTRAALKDAITGAYGYGSDTSWAIDPSAGALKPVSVSVNTGYKATYSGTENGTALTISDNSVANIGTRISDTDISNAVKADNADDVNLAYAVEYTQTNFDPTHGGDTTKGDPEGSQAKYLNGVINVNYTADGATTASINSHDQKIKVYRTATLNSDGKSVSYTPWTKNTNGKVSTDPANPEPADLVDELTKVNAPTVPGFTVDAVSGDTDAVTATDMAEVTPSENDTTTNKTLKRTVDYTAVEYDKNHAGTVEGTQVDYLQGKITVNTSYQGLDTPKAATKQTVNVQRTAHVGADGHSVTYGDWTTSDGQTTTLVTTLTTANATPQPTYDVTSVTGDTGAYDSAAFDKVIDGDATATPAKPAQKASDGYKDTLNRTINYTKHSFGPTDDGGTNDPDGTQAKYLNGEITVHYTAAGANQDLSSLDGQPVKVYRTATVGDDGHSVSYTSWTTNTNGKGGKDSDVLVASLAPADVPGVPGHTLKNIDQSDYTA